MDLAIQLNAGTGGAKAEFTAGKAKDFQTLCKPAR
jgi:hypothetical protein